MESANNFHLNQPFIPIKLFNTTVLSCLLVLMMTFSFFLAPCRFYYSLKHKMESEKNVPKSYTLVQKKGKNLQKKKEEKTKSSFYERCDEGRLGSRLCCICVWEAAESHELDSGTSWALKTLFIKSESGGQTCVNWRGFFLGCEPRVGEAEGCCCPPLRDQVQHGQQKTAEVMSFFFWPLVLFHQNIEQTPRLQFGDVAQITWKKMDIFFLEIHYSYKYTPQL